MEQTKVQRRRGRPTKAVSTSDPLIARLHAVRGDLTNEKFRKLLAEHGFNASRSALDSWMTRPDRPPGHLIRPALERALGEIATGKPHVQLSGGESLERLQQRLRLATVNRRPDDLALELKNHGVPVTKEMLRSWLKGKSPSEDLRPALSGALDKIWAFDEGDPSMRWDADKGKIWPPTHPDALADRWRKVLLRDQQTST